MSIVTDDCDAGKGGRPLLPQHRADLGASGLSDESARAAGVYSEADPAAVAALLNWKRPATALGPCLCFPFPAADGGPPAHVMVKPDRPRAKNGKAVKYESPAGVPLRAYVPPGTRAALADPRAPLLVTEGMKKALKADQEGFACVGLAGVYGWCRKRPTSADGRKNGRRELIPDLAAVAWRGRPVTVVFDSDAAANPDVARAERHLAEALAAAGAAVRVARLEPAADGAKVGLDDYLLTHTPDDLRRLIAAAAPPAEADEKADSTKPLAAADALADIGLAFDLWHDAAGAAYATAGRLSHPIRSKGFRHLLVNRYRKQTGKVPAGEALTNALAAVEAAAAFDGPQCAAHTRVAGHDGRAYLHLGDADSTVIEIDAGGWRACPDPPVRFCKPTGMLALPTPRRGGTLDDLRAFLNVPDDGAFALVVAWLTGCFRPDGPFPALVLLGEQGSAKTTTGRVVKRLIDPAAAAVRCEPREARDLMIQARNGWALAFDNLSHLPVWLSDAFCRLATGGGFGTRELFTDDGEVIFDAKRPLVVNGIEDFITRADLLERALLIRHPPIPEERRRPEDEFWAAFDAAHPALLGAVLDRVAAGLRERPRVRLDRLPRMADFALFAVACERGGGGPARFLAAYADNQAGAHEQALDASPLPAAVVALMDGRDLWEGTPAGLYAELGRLAPTPPPKDWPKAANALTNRLRRLAPNLRRVHGLSVEDGRESGGKSDGRRPRFVRIMRTPGGGRAGPSPPSPAADPSSSAGDFEPPAGDGPGGRCSAADGGTVPPDRSPPDAVEPCVVVTEAVRGDGGDGPRPPVSGRRFGNDDRAFDAEGNRW